MADDAQFAELFEELGPTKTAKKLGLSVRHVYNRRREVEGRIGRTLLPRGPVQRLSEEFPGRIELDLDDGVVLVGSDCHYWQEEPSTAHRAFLKLCRDLKPSLVIMNGDVLDGATISRHPPINWEERPSLIEEIEACQERLGEIESASKKARHIWTLGNHDSRFETKLASMAPEYAEVFGTRLKDHFPNWEPAWSVWINEDTIVKHRMRGGVHATYNNTLHAGMNIVTGHLHSLRSTPFTDYRATRYGIDGGCIADPWSKQFEYLEDNPRNWRSGFAVLTFFRSRLLWPEFVHVLEDGVVEFRGKVWRV